MTSNWQEELKVHLGSTIPDAEIFALLKELDSAISHGLISVSHKTEYGTDLTLTAIKTNNGGPISIRINYGSDAKQSARSIRKILEHHYPSIDNKDMSSPDYPEEKDNPSIGIIGQGFSGTITAIRILELTTKPLILLLFHSDPPTRYGGIAYGSSSSGWEHLLNIQAGRISLFRERPSDFLDWVSTESSEERTEWPREWKDHVFNASSAVPRRIYGQYLAARFRKAKHNTKIVKVIEIDTEVIDIQERTDKVIVTHQVQNKEPFHHVCDRVIITTGHDTPLIPSALRGLANNKRIIKSPYSREYPEALTELNPGQSIMIIGTGLSAYDAVLTLQYNKFSGLIYLVSRNGLTHKAYPGNHVHDIISVPFPAIPAKQLSAEKMYELLDTEIRIGSDFLKATQTVIDEKVVEERVLKALEPWTAKWIQRSEAEQVQRFLDLAKSRLTTSRTGIVPEVKSVVYKLEHQDRRLHLIASEIERVIETESGFTVSLKDGRHKEAKDIDVALIVSCLGYNADFSRTSSPVWRQLLDQRLALIHPKTHRGVAVGEFGELIRGDGSVSQRIFAVGPMRQGDEIERNGRLGAFVFSVGTIRNQALHAAIKILWLSENKQYSLMDTYTRRQVDAACEAIFTNPTSIRESRYLVNTILSVYLSNDVPFLIDDHKRAIKKWLSRHLEDASKMVSIPPGANNTVIKHIVWYQALMRAAIMATDISRLAHDHYRVVSYRTGNVTEFVAEKLAFSSILRASVAVFGASTASILVYSPDDKKLYPFAMYRRVQSFTPTSYGEGVAGALIKAFYEGEQSTQLDPRLIFRIGSRIIGTYVPNYNELPPVLKKGVYVGIERRFPAVLVSLLTIQDQVLGVVYVEAEKGKIFNLEDARLLAAMMSHKFNSIQEAQVKWDRQSVPFYRFGDFEGADLHKAWLQGQNLSHAVFKKAYLVEGNFCRANLTGASFDLADLSLANMKSTTIVGASFLHANLSRCNFDGADIRYCVFDKSDLTGCHFAGASFENCSFVESNLSHVELRDLDLASINFTNAVMRNCDLKRLTGVEQAVWNGIDLTGSRIDRDIWNKLPELVRRIHNHLITCD